MKIPEKEMDRILSTGMVHEGAMKYFKEWQIIFVEEFLSEHSDDKSRKRIQKLVKDNDAVDR